MCVQVATDYHVIQVDLSNCWNYYGSYQRWLSSQNFERAFLVGPLYSIKLFMENHFVVMNDLRALQYGLVLKKGSTDVFQAVGLSIQLQLFKKN